MATPVDDPTIQPEHRPSRRRAFRHERGRAPAELDHRIANSLQLAVDFLLFQHAQIADPVARRALIDAAERMVAVGHLHRFLCAHDGEGEVDLAPFLAELAALIGQSTGLRCAAEVESVRISGELAQQLGLAVNELAINAAKHAYHPGDPGDLRIHAHRRGERLVLSVADDGPGLGPGFDVDAPAGLGFNILQAIARELGARLTAEDDHGARFTLTLPIPAPRSLSRSFAPPGSAGS
jgi:two-component sensor histidine kinase